MPQPINPNPKAMITGLTMIYFSILMVMVLSAAIIFYLNYSGQNAGDGDIQLLQLYRYVIFALIPGGVASGYFIYKQKLAGIDASQTLLQKLAQLQAALLIRSACLEVPGLFGVVAAMKSGDNSFLLFTAIIIVLFILWRPTPSSIADDLQLSEMEKSEVES